VSRIVKDSAKLVGKQVDVKFEGEDLKLDTSLSKVLTNVLTTITRGCIDHSFESPKDRTLNGKNAKGIFTIKSYEDGENIIIELADDGRGLNLTEIRDTAIAKGLFSEEELALMPAQKMYTLVFETEVFQSSFGSERNDSARTSIENIGGKMLIDSHEGAGIKFVLIIPIPRSILIIKSLMVNFCNSTYSIPLDEVAEVVCLEEFKDSKVLHHVENSLILRHHDELLPLVDLAKTIGKVERVKQNDVMNVVIVKNRRV
jgi:two-component system chemotaxis sensor kinase CheA